PGERIHRGPRSPASNRVRSAWGVPPSALHGSGILLVGNVLHPFDGLAIARLLHRQVDHGVVRGGAMPVLLAGRNPDHVAGADLPHRAAPDLGPTDPRHDVKRLS